MTVRVVTTGTPTDDTFDLPADVLAPLDARYAAAGGGSGGTGGGMVFRGEYASDVVYMVNDVVVTAGSWHGGQVLVCIEAYTADGAYVDLSKWAVLVSGAVLDKSDANYNVALGTDVTAGGLYGVAAGHGASTGGQSAVAVGAGAAAAGGQDAVAVGGQAQATADGSIAIGFGAAATAPGAVAIGHDSAGTSAGSDVQDEMKLGTALTTVHAGKDVKTSEPTANGNPAWRLGAAVAEAVTLDATRYAEVMIGGVLVKLAVCA